MSAARLLLPDEPVAVRLMNTIWADRAGLHDAITTPTEAADWLAATGLLEGSPHIAAPDLATLRELRDACRAIAASVTDDRRPIAAERSAADRDAAIDLVNRTAAASPPVPQLRDRGGRLEIRTAAAGSPVVTALARAAADAIEVFAHDGEEHLRACYAPGCVLYFVRQHPRRAWCSPGCGNRARVARHYDRHRAERGDGAASGQ